MKLLNLTVTPVGLHQQVREGEGRWALSLSPAGDEPVRLDTVSAEFGFDFTPEDICFLNGYQSWTYSPERTLSQQDKSMRLCPDFLDRKFGFSRYADFFSPKTPAGVKKGWTYAYVRRGLLYHLFASCAEDTGFTRVEFIPKAHSVRFTKDCAGRVLQPGEEYNALDLFWAEGGERDVFDGWFAAMGKKALPAPPKTGYTSWYNCYQDISEAQILRDLEGLKALPIRPDIFQIDDGYETFVGDWLDVDEKKFPNGLEPVLAAIRDAGYEPGLWLAPFVAEKNSALYRDHPDWFLWEGKERVFAGGNWSGHYALDLYHPEVRDYLRKVFDHYRAMGFTLFKLDFLYGVCMCPRPDKTRGEIMAEAMDLLRELCGDARILGCGVPLASAFGRVEYCRIGPDMSLSYDDKAFMRLFHNERPSTLHTQRNTIFRRQLDGRAFRNDPDVFLLREENTTLTQEQKHTLAVVNALFGSVLFGSDDFGAYDEKKKSLFQALCKLQKAELISVEPGVPGKTQTIVVAYREAGEEKTIQLTV